MAQSLWFDNRVKTSKYIWHTECGKALVNSLSLIRSEEDLELTEFDLACLADALKHNRSILSLSILRTMPFIGNNQALAVVRHLANSRSLDGNQSIAKAAQACLPALEARVARLNVSETLLRPSSVSEACGKTLLRPAINSKDNASDELLRASLGDK